MKIYKLTSPNTDLVYVGKTICKLQERLVNHRSDWKCRENGNKRNYSSYKMFEFGEVSIELIEETEDDSREAFWINELNSCNIVTFKYDKEIRLVRKKVRVNCPHCNLEMNKNSLWTHINKSRNCIKN